MLEAMLASSTQSTPAAVAAKTEQTDEFLLEKAQASLAELQTHYTEEYPEVKAAERQVADLQAKMARAAKAPPASAVLRLRTRIQWRW